MWCLHTKKAADMKITSFLITVLLSSCAWLSCNKPDDTPDPVPEPYKLSYGDSILFMRPSAGDYIVNPVSPKAGTYAGFPEGIEIDELTGAINVTKSETGLRYRITHTAPDGTVNTAMVVLSGITFRDKFYNLSAKDTLALPVYNASEARIVPVSGSNFDEGNNANSGGCAVKTDDGKINLAQCVRNGVFGNIPQNDSRRDFDILYRLNDGSGKSLNKLRVRLYYYSSMADVAPDLIQTLQDRQNDGVFLKGAVAGTTARAAKPRPPCVIIVDH
jgi:hypothetical protein